MPKQPRLVDADKIIVEMEERVYALLRDPDKTYDVYPVTNALCSFIDRLKSDRYLPTPPVQPEEDLEKIIHPEIYEKLKQVQSTVNYFGQDFMLTYKLTSFDPIGGNH